jgi:orotate phosphoribosyltransferase-like protein
MRNNISKVNKLKEAILTLHKKGLSYRRIQNQLACSKSTISYHLGKGQKEKGYARVLKQRDNDVRYEPNRWQYIERHKTNKKVA